MELNDQPNERYEYDPELACQIVENIPRYTWPAVLDACVANIVDELPSDVLFRIAEIYLTDYYIENPNQIIPDMLRIKGPESTVYILDSLQLDKLPEPARKRAEEDALNSPEDGLSETTSS
jgi:hypothetical protein